MVISATQPSYSLLLGALICLSLGQGNSAQQSAISAAELSEKAQGALAARNMPEAEAALQDLTQLTPGSASVYAQLGLVYYMENRYVRAAQSFRHALKLSPRLADAGAMLGICLSEAGRYSEAVPMLVPAFRSSPSNQMQKLAGLELLHAYKNLQRFSDAEGLSQELLRSYPHDPEILYRVSRLHADESVLLIIRLMRSGPSSIWVHLVFAQINEDEGHYESAITQYRLALQMNPRFPGVHFNLGRALLLRSDSTESRSEALQQFEEEMAIDPESSLAQYEVGEIYRRSGELDKARRFFEKAVESNSQFEEAQIALGRTLIGLNEPNKALPHLLAAVRVSPKNEVSHFLLARDYQKLGDVTAEKKEMALFQRYQVQPYANPNDPGLQLPPEFGMQKITPQILDSK